MATVARKQVDGARWRIRIWSIDSNLLDSVVGKFVAAARLHTIKVSVVCLPTKERVTTVMCSPFVYKRAMEHYKICVMHRLLTMIIPKGVFINDIFHHIIIPSYVEINVAPEGSQDY